MTTEAVNICNSALTMIGADIITSFDDETREASVCNQIYETVRDTMLQKFPWRFSLTTTELSRFSSAPAEADDFGFDYAFAIPSDSLRILRTNDPTDDYLIFERKLFSNNQQIFAVYQKSVDETTYPAYFKNALELEMAARLAMALEDQAGKYQLFQNKADVELARAKNIDSQEQPVSDVGENNFLFTVVRT